MPFINSLTAMDDQLVHNKYGSSITEKEITNRILGLQTRVVYQQVEGSIMQTSGGQVTVDSGGDATGTFCISLPKVLVCQAVRDGRQVIPSFTVPAAR